MTSSALDQAIDHWDSTIDGMEEDEINYQIRSFTTIVRQIADGDPPSPQTYAAKMGISVAEAETLFERFQRSGMQFDDAGRIVGAALTTIPTPHQLNIENQTFYAWCALDSLFLPGLLNKTACVISQCPVSGEEIELLVSPEGVVSLSPQGTVVSIVLPGHGSSTSGTGPASPT